MSWKIELSPVAVRALRALPREEQEEVARRFRHLEERGLPPAAPREGNAFLLHGHRHVLVCLRDEERRTIVVVTLQPARVPAGTVVKALARRWMKSLVKGGRMKSLVKGGSKEEGWRHWPRT